jgi:tetratricopeptide (TPR) repeat protein
MMRALMRKTSYRAAFAVVVACALSSPPTARAEPAPGKAEPAASPAAKKEALALHDEARKLYERGEYRRAIEKLERAVTLDPAAALLVYNLALLHEKLAEVDRAEAYYRRYLELETEPAQREKALATLRRLEGAKRDLAKPEPKAPPSTAPPQQPAEGTGPRAHLVLTYVAAGVSGALLVAGAVLGASALATDPSGTPKTGVSGVTFQDLRSRADSAHAQAIGSDVCFALGVLATGATLALVLTRPAKGKPESAPAPKAVVVPGLASLTLSVRY